MATVLQLGRAGWPLTLENSILTNDDSLGWRSNTHSAQVIEGHKYKNLTQSKAPAICEDDYPKNLGNGVWLGMGFFYLVSFSDLLGCYRSTKNTR